MPSVVPLCLVLVGQPYDLVVNDGSSLKIVLSDWNFSCRFWQILPSKFTLRDDLLEFLY